MAKTMVDLEVNMLWQYVQFGFYRPDTALRRVVHRFYKLARW